LEVKEQDVFKSNFNFISCPSST